MQHKVRLQIHTDKAVACLFPSGCTVNDNGVANTMHLDNQEKDYWNQVISRQMFHHHRVSLSKQHTVEFISCHGTQTMHVALETCLSM